MDAIETFRNVLVAPYAAPWRGGVDHANCPPHARIARGDGFIDQFPDEARFAHAAPAPGTYLYGGPLKMHFGHVISDSVPRLHAFDPRRHRGVVFAPLGETENPPGWFDDILLLFGVKPEHVVRATAPTVFETMDFALPGTVVRKGPAPWYLDYLRRLPVEPVAGPPPKLFLGRRHILEQGGVMGESYFAALLQGHGFVSLVPEHHDIQTQRSLMAAADRIVFTEGSAILSADLLGSLNAEVFMLPRRNGGEALFGPQLAARAKRFGLLGGPGGILRLDNRRGMQKPDSPSYLLRPAAVHANMVTAGLVTEAFDPERFLLREQQDAIVYWSGDTASAESQLQAARQARAAI